MLPIWVSIVTLAFLRAEAASPYFVTTLSDFDAGTKVLTLTGATVANGFESQTTTITYGTSFLSTPSVAVGLKVISSTYTTTTLAHSFVWDLSVSSISNSQFSLLVNRTANIVTQAAINYIAVTSTFFMDVSRSLFDLSSTNVYTSGASTRTATVTMSYRTKSNSTNSVVVFNTMGIEMHRLSNTFDYALDITSKFTSTYSLQVSVPSNNRIKWIRICGMSYEKIASTISAPYYIDLGFFTDFAGTVPDSSGASAITTLGTIFTGMKDWGINDANSILGYSLTFSGRSYTQTTSSLTRYSAMYVWYRQQQCAIYYYLTSHTCEPCDISCETCTGPASTECLTCPTTRVYSSTAHTCACQSGYDNTGGRQCQVITCSSLCNGCSGMNKCAACWSWSHRQLVSNQCECKAYYYDIYATTMSPVCSSCHFSCYSCTNGTDCVSCDLIRDHRQYIQSNKTCTCVDGYYENNTAVCVGCQHSCATCSSATFCQSCNLTLGRIPDSSSSFCACQVGKYDDGLNQACVTCPYNCQGCSSETVCTLCPASRTLTNNDCVCSDGYYEGGNYECETCEHSCFTCIGLTRCDSCSSILHRTYDSTTGFCTCDVGYFDNGVDQECQACYVMCDECSGAGSTDCTTCNSGSFREKGADGSCVCLEGYFEVDANTQACSECYYTCETCADISACLTCNSANFRVQNPIDSSQCVCQDGYYDVGVEKCLACPYYCLTCAGPSTCLTCDPATRDDSILSSCPCLDGFYDTLTSSCLACSSQCLTCFSYSKCTSCGPNKRLTTSKTCVCASGYLQPSCTECQYDCQQCVTTADNCNKCNGLNYRYLSIDGTTSKGTCKCLDGYYSDNVNQLCQACHPSCLTCSSASACLTCPTNRQFDANNLYCQCVPLYYENPTSLNCLPCHYSCSTCQEYSVCLTCDSSKFRIQKAGVSLCECQDGYFDNGAQLCPACDTTCKTCSSYAHCLTCDSTTLFRTLDSTTNTCPCSPGYYESTVTYLCELCEYSCLTCDNGQSCVDCIDDRVLSSITGLCVCPDGYYEDPATLKCASCSYACTQCDVSSVSCTACESTHILNSGFNTCTCPASTFDNTVTCQGCLAECKTCTNTTGCLACRASDNREKVGVQCLCVAGYHDEDGTLLVCQKCHYSCTTCSNSSACDACADIRIQYVQGQTCRCPVARYYDDLSNPTCLPCSYSCLSCSGLSTLCTDCSTSAHRYLSTDKCLCLTGYYDDSTNTETCQQCHYSCSSCTSGASCAACDSAMHRVNKGATYCSCMDGFFDVTNAQLCSTCDYTCETCEQTAQHCLSCPTTRTYDAASYTCLCEDGMFDDGTMSNPTCQPCSYQCLTCENADQCLTCPDTRIKNSSLSCQCINNYYDPGAQDCLQCHPTCLQCSDYEVCTDCDTPNNGRSLFEDLCTCPEGSFDDYSVSGNVVCQNCHYSCERCVELSSCSSCNTVANRIRDISTGLCQCSDGFYDDLNNEQCQPCPFDCLTCSDATTCLTCQSQRSLDSSNRCVCSGSFYTNGTVCESCPPECSSCDSYTVCTGCNGGRTLSSGACVCASQQYPVSNSALCTSCQYSCMTCVSGTSCSLCDASKHRYKSNKLCRCLNGYYDDGLSNQLCQTCHYSCLTCDKANECLTCNSVSLHRVLSTSTKLCACTGGYYEDPNTKLCVVCHYSCKTCSDGSTCDSCQSTYERTLASQQCTCPAVGYFDKSPNPICATCDPKCDTCISTFDTCTGCLASNNRELQGSSCVCIDGYFEYSTNVICSTCSYKCLKCSTVQTECTECSASDNRDAATLPNCDCFDGYYDDQSSPACQLCDYRCLTCSTGYTCDSCDTATNHRSLNADSLMCECDYRYYDTSTSDPVCLMCDSTCLTCEHPTLCLTCEPNTRYYDSGKCPCLDGYYEDGSSLACQPCDYRCLTCDILTECSACDAGDHRQFNLNTGYCDCARKYYDVGDSVTSMCGTCDSSCYTCTNGTHCETCPPSTNQYVNSSEGTNYCICLYGYYKPANTQVCSPCHYSCERCIDSSTLCTQCDSAANRISAPVSGSCPCLDHYYDNGQDELCIQCFTNCVTCFGSNEGQCLTCDTGTFFLGGSCYADCPPYYFNDESTWKCGACSAYCTDCVNATSCITCQTNFLLFYNDTSIVCMETCPDLYYDDGVTCLNCVEPCAMCTAVYECINCIEGYYVDVQCYPCHDSCRYCTGGSAYDCITCIDGYYLGSNNVCTKLNCLSTQYVHSVYGCYDCSDTYPGSEKCTSTEILTCKAGYILSNGQCLKCKNVPGYQLVNGECAEICGDGIVFDDLCDDGNTLNGDGCSSICTVQNHWECGFTSGVSTCELAAVPTIEVESLTKVSRQNKIIVVLKLNIGVRLVKGNFLIQFAKGQSFSFAVVCLNSKYTRYQLTIEYFETIAKDTMSLRVVSPVQTSRLLQTLTNPLSISLQLSLELEISTSPPAIYYSAQKRSLYTQTLFYILIALHVIPLILAAVVLFYLRIKVMLLVVDLLTIINLIYLHSTLGLFNVSELASEACRALQPFIYPFGTPLTDETTSFYYFSYTQFIIAVLVIQLVILGALTVGRLYYSDEQKNPDKFETWRYMHLGALYCFSTEILFCCVLTFKWIDFSTLQGAYSWGLSITLLVLLLMDNGFYMLDASAHRRNQLKVNDLEETGPFGRFKSRATLVNAVNKSQMKEEVEDDNVFSEKDKFSEVGDKKSEVSLDPFAEEQMEEVRSRASDNKTEAVIFNALQNDAILTRKSSISSKQSQRSSTVTSMQNNLPLAQLYDFTPSSPPSIDKAYINYWSNYLHESYLPAKCILLNLLVIIAVQIQTPLPRCALLLAIQVIAFVYIIVTMKIKNARTIKLIVSTLGLMGLSLLGIVGSIITKTGGNSLDKHLYQIETAIIITVIVSCLWNGGAFVVQVAKSYEYRQYRIDKRNQEIIERNIRKNRLRNVATSAQPQSGIKNILKATHGRDDFMERSETKINLRMDSETPAEHINSSSNILHRGLSNRAPSLAIVDIEDLDYQEMGRVPEAKFKSIQPEEQLKNISPIHKRYSQMEKRAKADKDSRVVGQLEAVEYDRGNTQNMQSTRVKGSSRMNRLNNFLSRLQNQLYVENNETTIILQKQSKNSSLRKDDTLISIKESPRKPSNLESRRASKMASVMDRQRQSAAEPDRQPSKMSKKPNSGIIRDLIPTHEHDDDPNIVQPVSSEDSASSQEEEQEDKLSQEQMEIPGEMEDDEQQLAQMKGDEQQLDLQQYQEGGQDHELEAIEAVKQQTTKPKAKKEKHYKYPAGGNKKKLKRKIKVKPSNKRPAVDSEQEDDYEPQPHNKKEKNPIREDSYVESRMESKYEQGMVIGIVDDGFEQGIQANKPITRPKPNKSKPKKMKREETVRKQVGLKRIDSISSIGEEGRRFGELKDEEEEESVASEGVSVFKKILLDYQIYKDKKIRGDPMKKRR